MRKLRSMQAWADYCNLISYETSTVYRHKNIVIIRDYPTITSKKHLRVWVEDYTSNDEKQVIFETLKQARKSKHEYIIIIFSDDMYNGNVAFTFYDRNIMCCDNVWRYVLNHCTPTI